MRLPHERQNRFGNMVGLCPVPRDYPKAIFSGRKIRVISGASFGRRRPCIVEALQLVLERHAVGRENTRRTAHPESIVSGSGMSSLSGTVLENLVNRVTQQPVPGRVARDFAVPDAHQPVSPGAEPERAAGIRKYRPDAFIAELS